MNLKEVIKKAIIPMTVFLVVAFLIFYFISDNDIIKFLNFIIMLSFPVLLSLFISIKYLSGKEILLKTPVYSICFYLISSIILYPLFLYLAPLDFDYLSIISVYSNLYFVLAILLVSILLGILSFLVSLIIYFKKK